ncbi:MAG TPA: RHS repeat-associated core domain-containing protein, partial [Pyrinomonadaceae bacterium]|nr:RHS repeat-associated core domain-containing protein [Pyrinomonadaceae bacterium]
ISYPFSPWRSETAVWTTTAYDALGRTLSVTTPDSAAVSTSYSGNSVTVTDQALKKRKSVTDALGRLREVYEDPNGLNYQTSYNYDVLDSLVQVTQGSQQRYFMYDSLKRLIRSRNPEQSTNAALNLTDAITGNSAWSLGYQYDANGNLTQKTDGRGVVSTYAYDALNRNTTIDYSDTASLNPDVTRFYDGATNGKGRFWYFYSGGDFSNGSNVEATAVDSYDQMGRPLVKRQLSKLNGTWGTTYQAGRTYNLAGGVTSQTYPSGHTVSYAYDPAGRTTSFSGNLGDGVSRSYASSFVYNSRNQVTQELFGTQTPLYHKLQYNIRGQLWDVRVSTGADVNGSWNRGCLQFFYESTLTHGASGPDNNGNVLKASHYVPLDDQTTTYAVPYQLYTYDSLNRLSSVADYFLSNTQPNTQQSLQSYTYDRWGNRTINAAQTWGTGINNKQFAVDTATNRLGVPSGQSGVMSYDTAGNLITDTYTGVGSRTYDAENRMTTAADNTGQTSRYTYDADGHRVRRQVASSQEEWQIYGIDGELIAEYQANAPASAPEKEYGYRDGQLLITATGRLNVALAANGAVATASSTATGSGFSTTGAINGNYRGPWGNGEGWNDNTPNAVPDWLQVDFAGSKTIDEIDVFSLHDNYTQENTPTTSQTFTLYGLLAFDVQYWNGSSWTTVPGGSVTGNNKVWRQFTFSPITTSKIRVYINQVPDSWSRVVEIQAFGTSAGGEKVQWLVPDHLGTPRIILDQTGSLANVKRHDYLPFGEELFAGTGGRTTAQGYSGDGIRQQFTQKERDNETGLDYFLARYYSSPQGRFILPDPLLSSGKASEPQSWNRYNYCSNNPLNTIDPKGLEWWYLKGSEHPSPKWFDHDPGTEYERWTNTYDYVYYDNAARKFAVLDPGSNRYFIANTLAQANKLFDTYFASYTGVGSQAEGEFLSGLSSGANPFGILVDQANAYIGMDITSRDYLSGRVLGAGLAGGAGIFGSVVFKGAGAGITQLNKQLASEGQMAQVAAGEGEAIAGAGTSTTLRDAPRLAAEHGGTVSDWAKVRSWSYRAADGTTYEIHAYQNTITGKLVEYKTKIQ